jgi:hypothetical protein
MASDIRGELYYVIRDVASQLSLRTVRADRHGNPAERTHAAPPAYFAAKYVRLLRGHGAPGHTVPVIVCRTAQRGAYLGLLLWENSRVPECRAAEPLRRGSPEGPGRIGDFRRTRATVRGGSPSTTSAPAPAVPWRNPATR